MMPVDITVLQKFITEKILTLTKLFGQASYREYFRVFLDNGSTLILMKLPAGASSVAEEITKSAKQINELPFINIQKYLHALGLAVPKIVVHQLSEGFILLQDLGDQSLEAKLLASNKEEFIFFYQKAIALLVQLQQKASKNPSQDCIATFRKFDEDLFFWEWNHFLEYGLEDRLQIKIPAGEKNIFAQIGHDVCSQITKFSYGFTHRDFQSRNLMWHENQFYMIDFQDALIGPVIYDLVGLLRDSYIELDENILTQLQETYFNLLDISHPYYSNKEELVRHFDIMTLQRKLKDTGRFQYIHTVKKNSTFLKHVPASVRYVKRALKRIGKYPELEKILEKYVPEYSS